MMKILKLIIFFISYIYCQPVLLSPQNQDTLNYLHIPFKWSQEANALNYQIQVSSDIDFDVVIYDAMDSSLLELIIDGFDWSNQYYWRCRSYFVDGSIGEWSEVFSFSTSTLPSGLLNLNTILYDENLVYDGVTILDQLWSGHIFAIDLSGKPIWFLNANQLFDDGFLYQLVFTYFLDNGNILGYADGRESNQAGRAYEISIDNQLVWQGPANLDGIGVHHDVIRLSNGNTMALVSDDMMLPIPDGDWPIEIDQIIWRGDRIVEWDPDGNEIWSWSCFDYFSTDDWDYFNLLMSFGLGFYDWTHSNAIWFDEESESLYLSVRYLNRITKIDYQSGDVIWNMGEITPSGDADFGHSLGFSKQHSVKIIDNGHLMIFDNGNDLNPVVSRGLELSIEDADSTLGVDVVWEYVLPDTLSSAKMSDCDRLPNGNTLLTSTHSSYLVEVTPDSQKVWEVEPYQEFSTYRGERVAGLFPQLFSVLQPPIIESDEGIVLSVDSVNSSITYTVFNKGFRDQTFTYFLEGLDGWLNYTGSIDIASGNSNQIEFMIEPSNVQLDNHIIFSIYPINAPGLIQIFPAQLAGFYEVGDVNGDSSINIFDIIIIIEFILELDNPSDQEFLLSDVNADLNIDILDILMIIEIILL